MPIFPAFLPLPALPLSTSSVKMCANPSSSSSDDEMQVYRASSKRCFSGDKLPFDVKIITPPPRHLGRFQLDARTHCGDVLEHGDSQFVVKSVRVRYKYSRGGYHVIGKQIEVKSLARKAIEVYLENAWNQN